MGFRRPFAFFVMIAASAPLALALPARPASSAKPPASSAKPANSSAAPASSASAATPVDATKAAEAEFAKLEAAQTKPGDATAGQAKAAACGACHGMDGNSTDPQYPKLAGQNEQYIVAQLMRFKSGLRQNAIMSGMAGTLSPQDMHDIAAYFAKQKRLPGVADEKLAGAGEKIYRQGDPDRNIPACMACHGPDGAGNPGWRVPEHRRTACRLRAEAVAGLARRYQMGRRCACADHVHHRAAPDRAGHLGGFELRRGLARCATRPSRASKSDAID